MEGTLFRLLLTSSWEELEWSLIIMWLAQGQWTRSKLATDVTAQSLWHPHIKSLGLTQSEFEKWGLSQFTSLISVRVKRTH